MTHALETAAERGTKPISGARAPGIDLIKTLAIFFVVCVHFSLNTAYYTTPVAGFNMILQTVLRWLFISCVPLFFTSTGYLSAGKTEVRGHYPKSLRVAVPYVVISIACLAVDGIKNQAPFSLKNAVFTIFNFTADPYSWYVNMFVGLFLLMPFLNRLLAGLDRRAYHILMLVLTFVALLPSTFNPIFLYGEKFSYFYFPDFWSGIYPLFYYAAGTYIARFRPCPKARWCLLAVALMLLVQTALLILAQPYVSNNWLLTDYGSVFVALQTVALFLLLYRTHLKNAVLRRLLALISSVTLEIYLFSYIADSSIYPYFYSLSGGAPLSQQAFYAKYFLVVVPAVFLSSLLAALLLHTAYAGAEKGLRRLLARRKDTAGP